MKQIVIMPGGFHPFHAGHYALYKSALEAFPQADVYVAATNDQKARPFPFAIKEKLAKLAGVAPGRFIQVKSPFKAEEITSKYNPNEDVLIFVRSEKDMTEQPKPGGTKKDGTPAYFQPWTGKNLQPFSKHAYIAYLPTVEFGPGIKSATEIRNAWPTLNDKRKLALVMSLYPATQKNPKLAQNVVQLLDMGMGGQLNEFAPGNGDDGLPYAEYVVYQCDPKDQFEFIGGPLYQTDSLGMAHKYAYEMFLKHRPKAFVVYQPHKEASRGNYGVKGESDEQGVAEGLSAEEYKQKLLATLPDMMRFYEKNVQGWKPSEEQMLAAVETGYTVMKHTGDVKQAGKAVMDELNTLHRMSQRQQGVLEGAPIVVMPRADRLKKPEQTKVRYQGDIVPPTKPPSTEKRGVKGRPGQRPMPTYQDNISESSDYLEEK